MLSPILESAIARTETSPRAVPAAAPTPAVDAAIELTIAERDAAARTVATAAAGKLEEIIALTRKRAGATIARIMHEVPTDYLVPARGLSWDVADSGTIGLTIDGVASTVHRNALSQAFGRYDVPARYVDGLAPRGPWGGKLAEHVLRQHAANDSGRVLVRKVGDQIRALLSDRYRRLDSRPMLDAFLGAVQAAGMVVADGRATDVRVSVRAIVPEVVDICGDPNVFGLEWTNSDYGAGTQTVCMFALRLKCINGMTGETAMRNVHLGRRIEGDAGQISKRTNDLDTATMQSAIRDIVAATAEPAALASRVERVRASASERIDLGTSVPAAIAKALTKAEQDRMRDLFQSAESVMLPPEPTAFRLSNVLSWMANTTDSADRALDLERLAGQVAGI